MKIKNYISSYVMVTLTTANSAPRALCLTLEHAEFRRDKRPPSESEYSDSELLIFDLVEEDLSHLCLDGESSKKNSLKDKYRQKFLAESLNNEQESSVLPSDQRRL